MENINTVTLAEIVTRDHRAAEIFEKFGLDFCCSGNQRLIDACGNRNIDASDVVCALKQLGSEHSGVSNFEQWPLDFLADYIYNRHHKYVEEKTPLIKGYLEKLCDVHGALHPELLEIRRIFNETSGELAVHMKKEELMIFPYIRKLVRSNKTGASVSSTPLRSISSAILSMKSDHVGEGEQLHLMSILSNNYTAPLGACSSYFVTFQLLKEYEEDMHLHIHLENNILFPRALALEEEMAKQQLIR